MKPTAREICDELIAFQSTGATPDELIAFAQQRFGNTPELARGLALAAAEFRRAAAGDFAEAGQLERWQRARRRLPRGDDPRGSA